MKKVATLCVIAMSLASVPSFAQSQTIPSGFLGKWAGLYDKQEVSRQDIKKVCNASYHDKDETVILNVKKNHIEKFIAWEDESKIIPSKYAEHSPNKISGRAKLEAYELGSEEPNVSNQSFELELRNGKLHEVAEYEDGTTVVTVYSRCQ